MRRPDQPSILIRFDIPPPPTSDYVSTAFEKLCTRDRDRIYQDRSDRPDEGEEGGTDGTRDGGAGVGGDTGWLVTVPRAARAAAMEL